MRYRQYLAGARIYGCLSCHAHLATIHHMISRASATSFIAQVSFSYFITGVQWPTRACLPLWYSVSNMRTYADIKRRRLTWCFVVLMSWRVNQAKDRWPLAAISSEISTASSVGQLLAGNMWASLLVTVHTKLMTSVFVISINLGFCCQPWSEVQGRKVHPWEATLNGCAVTWKARLCYAPGLLNISGQLSSHCWHHCYCFLVHE